MISVDEALKTVDQLAKLEANWDSYDANPISPVAMAKAKEVLVAYPNFIQWVSPLPNGGVEIEWAFSQELSLEIEEGDDGKPKMSSHLCIRYFVSDENITDFELSQLYRFGTNRDQASRNYEANKRRAALRGEDVSKW